jgi:L-histidine Nalpha-methyltransferase
VQEVLAEIRAGLSRPQKELPSKLFYDERGSELFEEITRLPEYYPMRAEEALLAEHVPGWIAALRPRSLVELGAGSAAKTRIILDAMRDDGGGGTYFPVDISADFLERTAAELRVDYPGLRVEPVVADFTRPLDLPATLSRPALVTFLGSTIGNFPRATAVALLERIGAALLPGDRFLLGTDLRKDVEVLEAAYNDSSGVTAAFNLNVLHVLNRRFGADLEPVHFRHRAVYDAHEHRIEMHLVSDQPQTFRVPGAGEYSLEEGESIRTEISCKYDRESVAEMLEAADLGLLEWRQGEDGLFALSLAGAASAIS